MSSNVLEMDCIDCKLAQCDRYAPECLLNGKPLKLSMAERITNAVSASQKAEDLKSAKRWDHNRLDYSGLDTAWFKANARICGKYVVVTCDDGKTFAEHGLLLKPQRQGRMWRCQSKDPYLKSLVEPGRTTRPRRNISRAIASEKRARELSRNPCQLPEAEPVSDAYMSRDITRDVLPETLPDGLTRRPAESFGNPEQLTQDEERKIREMSLLQAAQDRKRETREKTMLALDAKCNQEALFDLIERFGMSYHLGAAMEHLCAFAAGGTLDFIEKAMAHLRRIQ